jgi:hypothetical protein
MRTTLRYLTPLAAAAGAVAAILAAPAASAEPAPAPGLPQCVDTGGSAAMGGSTTECATPGNVQINSTPAQQEFVGPWGDMWDEPGLFFP